MAQCSSNGIQFCCEDKQIFTKYQDIDICNEQHLYKKVWMERRVLRISLRPKHPPKHMRLRFVEKLEKGCYWVERLHHVQRNFGECGKRPDTDCDFGQHGKTKVYNSMN